MEARVGTQLAGCVHVDAAALRLMMASSIKPVVRIVTEVKPWMTICCA